MKQIPFSLFIVMAGSIIFKLDCKAAPDQTLTGFETLSTFGSLECTIENLPMGSIYPAEGLRAGFVTE